MALIPQVVDAVAGRVPVLGAGGIADERGVAAALMLGAEGAWIGTAFLATPELGLANFRKQALVAGDDQGTLVSRAITGKPARLVRNRWAAAYAESGLEPLPMPGQSAVAHPAAALAAGRGDIWPGFAGAGSRHDQRGATSRGRSSRHRRLRRAGPDHWSSTMLRRTCELTLRARA